ncbi:ABC transporter permease [Vandammella animalimorsus]|uniref:ABC transporter permease n=1 Tax=Vandammella animalimorsus TaxID=2029117 RepID=A0A2A2AYW0_9BURK|nr:FtsX-like permease family protein [Vandammella animalimorsus]PAT43775.1 hypothetical protein CK621_02740 [Vandammella animalimorsus]
MSRSPAATPPQRPYRQRLPFVWMVALRFLREGRVQTALVLAGITIGVAVVVFLAELIGELQRSTIARVLGNQAHIVMRPLEERNVRASTDAAAAIIEPRPQRLRAIDQWQSMLALAEQMDGVRAVSALVSGPAFAVRGRASKSVAVLGMQPQRYLNIVKMHEYMVQGQFALSGNQAIIGIDLAEDLGASVGDKIFLRTAEGRSETLQIAGLFDIGTRDLNRRWVFTTMTLAQNLLDLAGGASTIEIAVHELFAAKHIAQRLAARSGLQAESWMDTNAQLLKALRSQAASNRVISSFTVLVVALGIASVLVVSAVQKQKEIGILRAMGAAQRQIQAIFLLQGGLLGLAGSALGLLLALALLTGLGRMAPGSIFADVRLGLPTMAATVAGAVLIGLAGAWWPARRASRMEPVQAIKT